MLYMIKYAFADMLSFIRRKPLMFTLLYISMVSAIYFMLHSISGFIYDIDQYREHRSFDYRVSIDCMGADVAAVPCDAAERLKLTGVSATLSMYFPLDEMEIAGVRANINDAYLIGITSLPQKLCDSQYFMKEGTYISEDELSEGLAVCMASNGMIDRAQDGYRIGKTLEIDSTEFTVAGINNGAMMNESSIKSADNHLIVPLSSLRSHPLKIDYISLTINEPLSAQVRLSVEEWAKSLGANIAINWPGSIAGTTKWQNMAYTLLLQSGILVLSMLNSFSVLLAWMHINRASLYALYICGACKRDLLVITGIGTLFLGILASMPAWIIYMCTDWIRAMGDMPYTLNAVQTISVILSCILIFALIAALRCAHMVNAVIMRRDE